MSGSLHPAAGTGSDWKCPVTSVLQHLLLWPDLLLWIWRETLVELLTYPSVRLAGFISQSLCLAGCVSVFDGRASSHHLLGEKDIQGTSPHLPQDNQSSHYCLPIFSAHFGYLVKRTEIIIFLSRITTFFHSQLHWCLLFGHYLTKAWPPVEKLEEKRFSNSTLTSFLNGHIRIVLPKV